MRKTNCRRLLTLVVLEVQVSKSGLQLEDLSQKLSGPLRQKLISRLADVAYFSAFYGAPWKTGFLAGSIVKEVGVNEASIDAVAPYAVFVEQGTVPHEIRPMQASALAFEIGGQLIFRKLVRHPGTKPNPFMQRAAEDTAAQAAQVFRGLWEEEGLE